MCRKKPTNFMLIFVQESDSGEFEVGQTVYVDGRGPYTICDSRQTGDSNTQYKVQDANGIVQLLGHDNTVWIEKHRLRRQI
jgi:hypothetical protein